MYHAGAFKILLAFEKQTNKQTNLQKTNKEKTKTTGHFNQATDYQIEKWASVVIFCLLSRPVKAKIFKKKS